MKVEIALHIAVVSAGIGSITGVTRGLSQGETYMKGVH